MNREESINFVKQYVSDILTFFEVNVDVEVSVEDDLIEVNVPSTEINSVLIGRGAENLRSLQYMVSNVLRNRGAELTRVNIDIADYKKQRADRLAEKARGWIEEVRRTGSSHIAYLNPADRRVVHRVASEYSDIKTFSEGEGRDRHITIAQISS